MRYRTNPMTQTREKWPKSWQPPNFSLILDLKWPLKARDIFFGPWCQYKSCRYWSCLSKYGKWAKSLELFSSKLAKRLILGHFGYKRAKIAKTDFFFENPAVSVFLLVGPLTSCKKTEKSLEPFSVTFGNGLTNQLTNTHYRPWPQL